MSGHGDLVLDRFTAAAEGDPDAPAIHGEGEPLSYGTARAVVHDLAQSLARVAEPGRPIALCLRKSPAAVLLELACLEAGVPYVPVDAGAPVARQRQILDDSAACAIVSSGAAPAKLGLGDAVAVGLAAHSGAARAVLDGVQLHRLAAREPLAELAGGDIAYVLYTSGSTGVPKGVLISRENMGFFVDWTARTFPLGPGDQVAQHAPLHFDLPVYDVFVALTSGACLHLVDERTAMFPVATKAFLQQRGITSVYAVPSALNAVVERAGLAPGDLVHLRQVLYAGEEYQVPRLRALVESLEPGTRVCNLYGPVETNVVTWHEVTPAWLGADRMPIGRPAPGTDVRLLLESGEVTDAPGIEGELIVAGPSVSPGYLNDAERTARTRVSVGDGPDRRTYYRTGDHARIEDGTFRYHGRRDGMVKVRGFRIELGDIEAALAEHPGIAEAVACAVAGGEGDTSIEVHVVPRGAEELTGSAVRSWIAGRLPNYMVPASVHLRDDLPRTSTGKVARAELAGSGR